MSRRPLMHQSKTDNWTLTETHRGFSRWKRPTPEPRKPLIHRGRKP